MKKTVLDLCNVLLFKIASYLNRNSIVALKNSNKQLHIILSADKNSWKKLRIIIDMESSDLGERVNFINKYNIKISN